MAARSRTVETPNMHKHSNDAVDINENEAHSPCKNLEGRPINLDFSRLQSLRNQISMRSLVPRERNKMATRRSK